MDLRLILHYALSLAVLGCVIVCLSRLKQALLRFCCGCHKTHPPA